MAKTRMVNTRFWNDNFVSQLDPIEKLLFIYFITNEHTNICGIYELPLKVSALETGIDPSMFEKILPRLKDKILYIDGWVCVKNFPKYQNAENQKVMIGVKREMGLIPSHIIQKAIAYGYPMVDLSHSDSDSDSDSDFKIMGAKAPISSSEGDDIRVVSVDEDGNEPVSKWPKKSNTTTTDQTRLYRKVCDEFLKRAQKESRKPVMVLYTTAAKMMKSIVATHGWGEKEFMGLLDDWFMKDKRLSDLIQITQVLSANNVNKYVNQE